MYLPIGSIDVEELFRPKPVGEPVNMHVVEPVKEPEPDFEAMRRLIQGEGAPRPENVRDDPKRREVPQNQ
jgi:hypothetical protein